MKRTTQMSESFRLGALLAVAGGFLDAYTYLNRGGVFANAQTGNMVLLAICLIQGAWARALSYSIPILAFASGVLVTELVRRQFQARPTLHWRQMTVAAEAVILLVVAFLPQRFNMLANVAVSFTCAIQVESFRKVHGSAFATTMCTGNLRSGTEQLFHCLAERERGAGRKALHYYGIIFFFLCGSALGGVLSGRWGEKAAFCCCGLLLLAFVMMFFPKEGRSTGSSPSAGKG